MNTRIFYNDFEFSTGTARPWLGVNRQFVSDEGAPPQKANVEYTVKTWFMEPSFADNQARWRLMLAALATTEGTLRMVDENGTEALRVVVRPGANALPEQWGQHIAEVSVVFRAVEDLSNGASAVNAVYAPTVGGQTTTFPNVLKWHSEHSANRYSPHLPNRRETLGTITASGRKLANPGDPIGTRRAFLEAEKLTLEKAIDSKEGNLTYLGETRLVKIERLEVTIDDASTEVTWSFQAGYQRFPAGDYAEAEFTVKQVDNQDRSERRTTVAGKVRADDEAGALSKVTAIRNAYLAGRMLLRNETGTPRLDGADGATFVDVDFSCEFREALDVLSYQLTVGTRADTKSGQTIITYNGSVTAKTSTAALAKARTWSTQYPYRLMSNETIEVLSVAGATEQTIQIAFSYEYLTKGTALWAEVNSSSDHQIFGANTLTVSGTATADTEANAYTLARSFKPTAAMLPRVDSEQKEFVKKDGNPALFVKVTFTYAYHDDALVASISYGVKTSEDLVQRRKDSMYSGVAYGPTEDDANALIDALIGHLAATDRLILNERESQWDKSAALTKFKSRSFNLTVRGVLDKGTDDILEAQWSVESVYSVQAAILTPIPFGSAHVQPATGLTIGRRRVRGRVVCLNEATGKAWARGKMPVGGYQEAGDAPKEDSSYDLYPLSDTTIRATTIAFDYGMGYPNLTG